MIKKVTVALFLVVFSTAKIAQEYSQKEINEYSVFINKFTSTYSESLKPLIATIKIKSVSDKKIIIAFEQFKKQTKKQADIFDDYSQYPMMHSEHIAYLLPKLKIDYVKQQHLSLAIKQLKDSLESHTQNGEVPIIISAEAMFCIVQLRKLIDTIGADFSEMTAIEGLLKIDAPVISESQSNENIELQDKPALEIYEYSANQVISILTEDVFSYYSEELKDYDTPLKKQMFRKSDEYKNYLKSIRELAKQIISGKVRMFDENVDSLSEYDVNKKGFYYHIGANFTDYGSGDYPISKNGFCFDRIPTSTIKGIGGTIWRFFLPCDENIALDIENNSDIVIVYTFNVTGVVEKNFKTYVMGTGYLVNLRGKYVNTNNIEISLVNKTNNEILKTYHFK